MICARKPALWTIFFNTSEWRIPDMYAQGSNNLIPLNLVLTIVNIFPTNNDSVSCPADLAKNKLILPEKNAKNRP